MSYHVVTVYATFCVPAGTDPGAADHAIVEALASVRSVTLGIEAPDRDTAAARAQVVVTALGAA